MLPKTTGYQHKYRYFQTVRKPIYLKIVIFTKWTAGMLAKPDEYLNLVQPIPVFYTWKSRYV